MELIRCISEKKIKWVYCKLISNLTDNMSVNGAILNLLSNEFFELNPLPCDDINDCYWIQKYSLFNTQIQIDTPIICPNSSKTKFCNKIDKNNYFLNSFYCQNRLFPQDALFKENNLLSSDFKYYYLEKKDCSLRKIEEKFSHLLFSEKNNNMDAVTDFYNALLKDNSTTEGTYILINIMMLLFNTKFQNTSIRSNSAEEMKNYICSQLQNLDNNANYEMDMINRDYTDDAGNQVYNLLEWRILNGFCKAFNSLTPEKKRYLRNIFNEKSKTSITL